MNVIFQRTMRTIYALATCVFAWLLWKGSAFYLTPFEARPHHPDYALYRPAGTFGLGYGIAGSGAMLLLLLYSLRRRTRWLGRTIPIKYWLDIHIFLGVFGPAAVLLHTSFKWDGLVALSFWSMVGVGLSGLLGRYLYLQVPRKITGEELEVPPPAQKLEPILDRFPQLTETHQAALHHYLGREQHSSLKLLPMIAADLARPFHRRQLKRLIAQNLAPPQERDLMSQLINIETHERRLHRLRVIVKLFHVWHVVHRPFALIMYIIMFVHIGIALLFGISWR